VDKVALLDQTTAEQLISRESDDEALSALAAASVDGRGGRRQTGMQ